MVGDDFLQFSSTVEQLTGINLASYKETQLNRRLAAIMRRAGVETLSEYAEILRQDAQRLQQFKDFFTINVSQFFRNPEKFAEIKNRVFPGLLTHLSDLRIWSAGCSLGAEPYSLAMLLEELDAKGGNHTILATDVDETILAKARSGWYSEREVDNIDPDRLQRFFVPEAGGWRVAPEMRRRVEFRQHNLLSDPYPRGFDMIICRNVVIYFTDEAKDIVYREFRGALRPGGVLFVGATEIVIKARELGFESLSPFFYRLPLEGEKTVGKAGVRR